MSIKAIPMSFTFTARPPKLPKLPKFPPLRLSPEARQRIREQLLAMRASMDAFTRQMQAIADAAKVDLGRMKRRIERYSSHWSAKDDGRCAVTDGPPTSPFGYIVDVVAAHPGPKSSG